jgi:ABC-type multidrug transport system fused ATPase/permease subunit
MDVVLPRVTHSLFFSQPTGGRITLAGTDVRSFDKSEWAQAVSLVAQEPVLFAMSAFTSPDTHCRFAF